MCTMPIVGIKEFRHLLPPKSRLLALDHSPSRIGIAMADRETGVVGPLAVLRGKNFTENVELLAKVCHEFGVTGLILGLPLNMDNTEGPRAQSVRHFALNLDRAQDKLGFAPVITFVDERLSSFDADERLDDLDPRGRRKGREMQDALAACAILEDALKLI